LHVVPLGFLLRLAVLAVWYTTRIFSNKLDKWIVSGKIYKNLAHENLINYVEKETEDPIGILSEKLGQWVELTEKIRDPIIESVVAIVLLVVVYSVFPQILLWLIVSVHIVAGILVWISILWIHITYESKKLPSKVESEISDDE
jgi:hypothetical protein